MPELSTLSGPTALGAQTTLHVASGSDLAVQARFGAFLMQIGCLAVMVATIL